MPSPSEPDQMLHLAATRIRQAIADGRPEYGEADFALPVASLLDELAGDVLTAAKSGTRVEHNYAITLAAGRAALALADALTTTTEDPK